MRLHRLGPWLGPAALSWFVAGWLGLVSCVVVGVGISLAPRFVLGAAVAAPVVLAVMTVTEADTDPAGIRVFAAARPLSHDLGLVMVIIWCGASVIVWRRSETSPVGPERGLPGRRWWVLALLVVVALATTALTID